jgi:hypothetical protein
MMTNVTCSTKIVSLEKLLSFVVSLMVELSLFEGMEGFAAVLSDCFFVFGGKKRQEIVRIFKFK